MASVLFAPSVRAADASKLIETMTNEIGEIAKTKTGADRQAALRQVVLDNLDLPYMGRTALGTRWNQASQQQQARLLAAIEASESRIYGERLGKYAGYTVTIGKVTPRPNSAWTVDSHLNRTGGQPTTVEWEVHESGRGLRIADIKVEGVSLSALMRAEFGSYIQGNFGGVESLVRELEARAVR
jgi:phospholipid transport system substrate-binding protein